MLQLAHNPKIKRWLTWLVLFLLLLAVLLIIVIYIKRSDDQQHSVQITEATPTAKKVERKITPTAPAVGSSAAAATPLAVQALSLPPSSSIAAVFSMDGSALFQAYKMGLVSATADDKLIAKLALSQCEGFAHPVMPPQIANKTPEEIKAIAAARESLIDKCEPFQSTKRSQLSEDSKVLNQSVYGRGAPLYGINTRREATEEEWMTSAQALRSAFETFGPSVLVETSGALTEWLTHHVTLYGGNGLDPVLFSNDTLNYATSIALCEVSFDCRSASYLQKINCTFGECGNTYQESVLRGLNDSQRRTALTQAHVIATALNEREFKALGLLRNGR